jgi:amidase
VYGLKPSYGRVSRSGVHPAVSTLDCVGPMARDMPMIERAMQMLDPAFRPHAPPSKAIMGWVSVHADPEVAAAARGVLEQTNISVRPVSLPAFESAYAAGLAIIGAENWAAYGHLAASEALGMDVRTRLLAAREFSAADVAAAERVRRVFRAEVDEALTQVDALALPTLPDFPPTLAAAGDWRASVRTTSFVRPFNLSGHPAITLPVAAAGSLPIGLQLVGRLHADEALCALARMVAQHL